MARILRGYDFDRVCSIGINLEQPCVIVSGRTFSEYDDFIKSFAQEYPVYIRGVGSRGDAVHAGLHKASIINLLGITEFYEDDPVQMRIILEKCPSCTVYLVSRTRDGKIVLKKQCTTIFLIVDKSTFGGAFFVGKNMDELIKSIQHYYRDCCTDFKFSIYRGTLNKPILKNSSHTKTHYDLDEPGLKVELGTREVRSTVTNTYEDNHICFPILPECNMMEEFPKKLFLHHDDDSWTVSDKNDNSIYDVHELQPSNTEFTVFHCDG